MCPGEARPILFTSEFKVWDTSGPFSLILLSRLLLEIGAAYFINPKKKRNDPV